MSLRRTFFKTIPGGLTWVLGIFAALVPLCVATIGAELTAEPKIQQVEFGIKNFFKVGYWTPVRVAVDGVQGNSGPQVDVTVVDNDGVPTVAGETAKSTGGSGAAVGFVFTKMGRVGSPIRISLRDGERQLDEKTVRPDVRAKSNSAAVSLPATAELIVSFGSAPFGLREAFPNRDAEGGQPARQVVEVTRVADLPTEWIGYDAVDVFVLSVGNGQLYRDLVADATRYAALERWVELGGRLVVLCDGNAGKELLAREGPLTRFAPGKLAEAVRLPETGSLEHFAGAAAPISVAPGTVVRVPRFVDVDGAIEAYAGKKPTDLPLVVRVAHGFGEVTFASVDLSQPPMSEWAGRVSLLQVLLRPYLTVGAPGDATQRLVTRGYNDLGGALRQQLGQSFVSVAPVSFAVVAVLAILYIAFLGPLDYLFVNRWLKRPLMAWVTFALIIAAFCGAAVSMAAWRNGGAVTHANRLELVDVDTLAGRVRGTLWTTIYSPVAKQFDLSVKDPKPAGSSVQEKEILLSWWGLPGTGIGGMQSSGMDLGIIEDGYRYADERSSLLGVPVLTSATKSLFARWTGKVAPMMDVELTDQDGLAAGSITNRTDLTLRNVRLLYGAWAYRLGDLGAGKRLDVGEQLSPRKVKTIVTHDALGNTGAAKGAVEGQIFVPEKATAKEILSLMMFYDAAGGLGFAHLPNRYQTYCDLSRELEVGRAILVGEASGAVAPLVDNATGADVGDKDDDSTVVYRFVLPVKKRGGP